MVGQRQAHQVGQFTPFKLIVDHDLFFHFKRKNHFHGEAWRNVQSQPFIIVQVIYGSAEFIQFVPQVFVFTGVGMEGQLFFGLVDGIFDLNFIVASLSGYLMGRYYYAKAGFTACAQQLLENICIHNVRFNKELNATSCLLAVVVS